MADATADDALELGNGIERLREGEPVAAGWLTLMEPAVGEIMTDAGYDVVFADTEHTTASLEAVENAVRGIEAAGGTDALVRVPSDDPTYLKRVLDVGVGGVMVPMIETADQARQLVRSTRYPPEGTRGTGAWRAQAYGDSVADYVDSADDRLVRIAQIETPTAVDNAADIAAVEGIDSLFVGPVDLSTGLGALGDTESDAFVDAVESVLEAAHAENKPVGVLALDEDETAYYDDLGFDWQIVGVDIMALREGVASARSAHGDVVGE